MSSHNHRAARWIFTSLFACLLTLGTTSCASKEVTEDAGMSDGFVTIEHAVNDPDPMSITVPDGWVDNIAAHDDNPSVGLNVTRTLGERTRLKPGLWATVTSPNILVSAHDGDLLSVNIQAYRDRSIRDGKSIAAISDQKTLPDRTIDGLTAPGEQYTYTEEDGTTRVVQAWYVLRRDGIWEIFIRSEPNSTDIPQELFNAIDTIHWTPPGDGTGTEKES